jgi:hypothetical protein
MDGVELEATARFEDYSCASEVESFTNELESLLRKHDRASQWVEHNLEFKQRPLTLEFLLKSDALAECATGSRGALGVAELFRVSPVLVAFIDDTHGGFQDGLFDVSSSLRALCSTVLMALCLSVANSLRQANKKRLVFGSLDCFVVVGKYRIQPNNARLIAGRRVDLSGIAVSHSFEVKTQVLCAKCRAWRHSPADHSAGDRPRHVPRVHAPELEGRGAKVAQSGRLPRGHADHVGNGACASVTGQWLPLTSAVLRSPVPFACAAVSAST